MSNRRILLADADAFFVAVARIADPDGAGKAKLLIVGGKPGSRGVVCSASYEARMLGVRSAMPISQALRLCPNAMCVPVPRTACGTTSRAIAAVLARYTPVVQSASIDEWYLDMSGTEALYGYEPLESTASRIRDAVYREVGIQISLGGGSSKLIAKLAVERAKPKPSSGGTGVHIVDPGSELEFMRTLELGDIPGIGPKLQQRLASFGLSSVRDVLDHDKVTLIRWFGRRQGEWLWQRAQGISSSPVEVRAPARQMSRETTFSRDINQDDYLNAGLRAVCSHVGSDLRGARLSARTVTVKLKDSDFTTRLASKTLDEPIESDSGIIAVAAPLLAKLRRARNVPARLVGVALGNLTPASDAEQLTLFVGKSGATTPAAERPQDRAVSRVIDRVRKRFGDDAIRTADLSFRNRRS